MPTFTAIAFDRFLEPGASKPVDNSNSSLVPVPTSNLDRLRSLPASPALYATPEATPLPDSPSQFTPSPYIVNHKRRGPRLLKSYSVDNVASNGKNLDNGCVNGIGECAENKDAESNHSVTFFVPNVNEVHDSYTEEKVVNGAHETSGKDEYEHGSYYNGIGNGNGGPKNGNAERDSEVDDFFDPNESIGYTSNTDCEDNLVTESSFKFSAATPGTEFFDACEELSSDSAQTSSLHDVEAELRGVRLNLLMEIEKRRLVEETLNSLQSHWQRIKEQLADVGLTLPAFPSAMLSPDVDPAEEICRQVELARFVSDAIGRGIGKAEAEMEKDAQIEAKNFEIARLLDRLRYYEAVNREMSQRNQEAVEMGRRNREVMKRKRRWVWGSIATAITLGTVALIWSYIPPSGDSSPTIDHDNPSE